MDPADLPLRDIHLPDPVSVWPPAPGWWISAVLIVAFAATGYWVWRRWRKQYPMREGLALLRGADALIQQGQPVAAVQLVSAVLRRVAMTLEHGAIAGLTGRKWLEWLDSRWSRQAFVGHTGELLLTGPYQRDTIGSEDATDLLALVRAWLRVQRLED